MSTNATPAPTEAIKANPVLTKSIGAYITAAGKLEIARDNMNTSAKSEAVKHGYDKKSLTAILFASGLSDARTVSEVVGFVFPKNAENRATLDKVIEENAKQTDNKLRISKPVQLAIQRSEVPLTIEEAKAKVEASKSAGRAANPPGGVEHRDTTGASKPAAPLTAKEQEQKVMDALSAAASLAKSYGYDRNDFDQTLEAWQAEYQSAILPPEVEETTAG